MSSRVSRLKLAEIVMVGSKINEWREQIPTWTMNKLLAELRGIFSFPMTKDNIESILIASSLKVQVSKDSSRSRGRIDAMHTSTNENTAALQIHTLEIAKLKEKIGLLEHLLLRVARLEKDLGVPPHADLLSFLPTAATKAAGSQ